MRNRRPEVNAEMTRMIARPDKEDSDSKTQVHSHVHRDTTYKIIKRE